MLNIDFVTPLINIIGPRYPRTEETDTEVEEGIQVS